MASYVTPKRATEYIFYISLVSQANTKIFQANPTIAAGDFKVSIDGGALANPGTLPAVTPASSKLVKVTLSIAEMTGDNISLICSDASGAEWCDLTINIQTSLRQIDDLATQASVNTIDDFLDMEIAAILAAVDLEVAGILADTDNIQTRLPAALGANGNMMSDARDWIGTALASPDTAGYPKVTIKDGSGAGEINLTGGAVDQVASVTSIVAVGTGGITAASIAAGAIGASEIATDAANKIADHVLRRKQANVEASADGDLIADAGSQYGLVQQAQKSNTVDNAGFLTVYETDGVTEVERIPLDTDAAADPIVGAG